MPSSPAQRIVTAHEEPELDFLIRRLARRLRMAVPTICVTQFPRARVSSRCPPNRPSLLVVSEAVFRDWEGDELEQRLARTMEKIAEERRFRLVTARV